MGLLNFLPTNSSSDHHMMTVISSEPKSPSSSSIASKRWKPPKHSKDKNRNLQKQPSSWDHFKSLLNCKQIDPSGAHRPSKPAPVTASKTTRSSCGSFRDVIHGNTRVVHRPDNSPESSSLGQETPRKPAGSSGRALPGSVRSPRERTATTSSRGMPLRKLSGCYECRMIVDPSRYPIIPRSTVCPCPQCGQIFPKIESLEHHQAVMHAVSELGPEDSGRNIVEIIFKSSWTKKDGAVCKIERILKVHNTRRTIQRFEDCRDAVKLRASAGAKKNPRCAADGNELLRFFCTGLACALGSRGSSSLCSLVPGCGVCTVIRHGFQGSKGVQTTASSGRAHDSLESSDGRRAMLVSRVIAGRVRRSPNDTVASAALDEQAETTVSAAAVSYDSVAGAYSDLEDLVVFNSRAILPCFVVIYKTIDIN